MGHDPAVVELAAHGQPAEHGLADDADGQQGAEPHEVAAVGPAAQRPEPGETGGEHDGHGDDAVGELDHRVGGERRVEAPVALGPLGTAEAGVGEPHGGAGEHDQREGDEGHVRQEDVLAGRDGVTVGALAQAF